MASPRGHVASPAQEFAPSVNWQQPGSPPNVPVPAATPTTAPPTSRLFTQPPRSNEQPTSRLFTQPPPSSTIARHFSEPVRRSSYSSAGKPATTQVATYSQNVSATPTYQPSGIRLTLTSPRTAPAVAAARAETAEATTAFFNSSELFQPSDMYEAVELLSSPAATNTKTAKLEELPLSELVVLLEEREAAVVELRHEINVLREAPKMYEQRLAELEAGVLGRVAAGSILKVRSPVLHGMSEALSHSHAFAHEDGGFAKYGTSTIDSFVMGRHYLPLDLRYEAERQRHEELKRNRHPTIKESHYAGFIAQPAPPPPRGPEGDDFWLDCEPGEQAETHAPERWMRRHDQGGDGEDAIPIDWLGRAKRGLPATKQVQRPQGLQAPPWLY